MANDINSVILVGRLTRDAELKTTTTGSSMARISIAVNKRKKIGDQWTDEAHFFDVTIWGKTAEGLSQYLTKGKQIAVQGELRQSRWEQDGQNRSRIEISAQSIQLLGGRDGTATGAPDTGYNFDDSIPF